MPPYKNIAYEKVASYRVLDTQERLANLDNQINEVKNHMIAKSRSTAFVARGPAEQKKLYRHN